MLRNNAADFLKVGISKQASLHHLDADYEEDEDKDRYDPVLTARCHE